jgi:hypothetical protein
MDLLCQLDLHLWSEYLGYIFERLSLYPCILSQGYINFLVSQLATSSISKISTSTMLEYSLFC